MNVRELNEMCEDIEIFDQTFDYEDARHILQRSI